MSNDYEYIGNGHEQVGDLVEFRGLMGTLTHVSKDEKVVDFGDGLSLTRGFVAWNVARNSGHLSVRRKIVDLKVECETVDGRVTLEMGTGVAAFVAQTCRRRAAQADQPEDEVTMALLVAEALGG
jgi:hypothetical protein